MLLWLLFPVLAAIRSASQDSYINKSDSNQFGAQLATTRTDAIGFQVAKLPGVSVDSGAWIVPIEACGHGLSGALPVSQLHAAEMSRDALKSVLAALLSLITELAQNEFYGCFDHFIINNCMLQVSIRRCGLGAAVTKNIQRLHDLVTQWAQEVADSGLQAALNNFSAQIQTAMRSIGNIVNAYSLDSEDLDEVLVRIALNELRYNPILVDDGITSTLVK